MDKVGLRELKNSLSEYVSKVRNGASLLVTDRGKPVAELRPVGKDGGQVPRMSMDDLVRSGLLTLGKPNHPGVYPAMTPVRGNSSAELLDDERGTP